MRTLIPFLMPPIPLLAELLREYRMYDQVPAQIMTDSTKNLPVSLR